MSAATHPAHVDLSDLLLMRHAATQLNLLNVNWPQHHTAGKYRTRLRGRGMDFDQVRRYQAGDDSRNIDWRVTARTGETHSRVFQEERERPVFLVVEQSNQLFFTTEQQLKSTQAALTASLFGWAALHNQDRIGGMVFNDRTWQMTSHTRERSGLLHLMQQIVDYNQQLEPLSTPAQLTLTEVLKALQAQLLGSCTLVLICAESALTTDSQYQLLRLAEKHDLLLLPIYDPLEHQLPSAETLALSFGRQRLRLEAEQVAALQFSWQQRSQQLQQRWQQLAARTHAPLLALNTSQEVIKQLMHYLTAIEPR